MSAANARSVRTSHCTCCIGASFPCFVFGRSRRSLSPTSDPTDLVTLEIVEALPPMQDLLAPQAPEVWTRGDAQHVLAEMLGHRMDDTRLLTFPVDE